MQLQIIIGDKVIVQPHSPYKGGTGRVIKHMPDISFTIVYPDGRIEKRVLPKYVNRFNDAKLEEERLKAKKLRRQQREERRKKKREEKKRKREKRKEERKARKRKSAVKSEAAPKHKFSAGNEPCVGELVSVRWQKKWYTAEILQRGSKGFDIRYIGYETYNLEYSVVLSPYAKWIR